MRRGRVATGAFVVAAVTSFWWVAAAPSQGSTLSASITKTGWWSQQPGAQAQPDGGFQVAQAATGPQSVAGLEVTVDQADGITATLSLTQSQSVAGASAPTIQACSIVSSAWKADNPGAWGDQPPSDCGRKVDLQLDAASSTWKGDVSSLITPGGTSGIMIVPVANPVGGLVDPGFQLTFSGAKIEATGTTAADSTPAAGFDSSSSSTGSSSSSSSSSSGSGFSSTGTPSGSGFSSTAAPSSPSIAFPSSPAAATAAPPAAAAPSVATPAAPSAPAAAPPPPISTGLSNTAGVSGGGGQHDRPWGRLMLFVPLAVVVGLVAMAVRRTDDFRSFSFAAFGFGYTNDES